MLTERTAEKMIHLNDTTLRDGEQSPGLAFSAQEKERLALLLDEAGVDGIEAGTPACGSVEREALRRISRLGLAAKVSAWCRAREEDIVAAHDCGIGSVVVAISLSDIHLTHKFRQSVSWAMETMERNITFARKLGLEVCAAMEDASRTPRDRLSEMVRAASDAGAHRIRISDTVGILEPLETAALLKDVNLWTSLPVEFHAHNDLGMATANAVAAAQGGATHLSVTLLGIGERAGNAALEEVAMALDRCKGMKTGIDPTMLMDLCASAAALAGRTIAPDKPIVGGHAFTHESGIHVDGILKDPTTYEPFPPEKLGRTRSFVFGKHSGRSALRHFLATAGATFPGYASAGEDPGDGAEETLYGPSVRMP